MRCWCTLPTFDPFCLSFLDIVHIAYRHGRKRKFIEGNWLGTQGNDNGSRFQLLIKIPYIICSRCERGGERYDPKYSRTIFFLIPVHFHLRILRSRHKYKLQIFLFVRIVLSYLYAYNNTREKLYSCSKRLCSVISHNSNSVKSQYLYIQ